MRESVLRFDCEGVPLVGILAEPDVPTASVAVVTVVGGPQYRAGSHRQFVRLGRHLATNGYAALRFDYRGMGDSGGAGQNFEAVDDDIEAAIAAVLAQRPQLKGVVLHGLCDGAAAALMYCERRRNTRVLGLALQNPWFRSEQGQAKAVMTHYYGRRLRSLGFWKKLLGGGIGWRALAEWLSNRRASRSETAPAQGFRACMVQAWSRDDLLVLLQLAQDDLTAQEFVAGFDQAVPGWSRRPRLTQYRHANADHTFSNSEIEQRVQTELVRWLAQEVTG